MAGVAVSGRDVSGGDFHGADTKVSPGAFGGLLFRTLSGVGRAAVVACRALKEEFCERANRRPAAHGANMRSRRRDAGRADIPLVER